MSEGQRIVIQELGKSAAPRRKLDLGLDLQDYLLVIGVLCGELAAFIIWRPAALILGCVFALGFAYLIEKAKPKERRSGHSK